MNISVYTVISIERGATMAERTWQTLKIRYCEHAGEEIAMEAEVLLPATWLPEQAPRIIAHRCSRAVDCNLDNRASCIWAGTNPNFDPFTETE
jgi:hypothetical protein